MALHFLLIHSVCYLSKKKINEGRSIWELLPTRDFLILLVLLFEKRLSPSYRVNYTLENYRFNNDNQNVIGTIFEKMSRCDCRLNRFKLFYNHIITI